MACMPMCCCLFQLLEKLKVQHLYCSDGPPLTLLLPPALQRLQPAPPPLLLVLSYHWAGLELYHHCTADGVCWSGHESVACIAALMWAT